MTKAIWGEKGLFGLRFYITVYHCRYSGQELKQSNKLKTKANAEAVKRFCFLAVPHGLLSLIS